jgi:DNA invertase Pin-like site-specific DNA recombinase
MPQRRRGLRRGARVSATLFAPATVVALDLGVDLSTPAGEFLANVMASAAQWERRIIGQRTKDALAEKRAQGIRIGRRHRPSTRSWHAASARWQPRLEPPGDLQPAEQRRRPNAARRH